MSEQTLVLGGSGFIGSALVRELSSRGTNVISFDQVDKDEKLPNVSYEAGNYFDTDSLVKLIGCSSAVVLAVGAMNPGNSVKGYMRGYEDYFSHDVRILDACANRGVKVLFLSSGGTVYGPQSVLPISEDVAPSPINHYGALKLCVESAMSAFEAQTGCKMIAARVANPYGPGQDYRKGVGFIGAAIAKAISGEFLEIWGDGSTVRDYVYIDDVAKMLAGLLEYSGPYSVFNVGTGIGTSQIKVLELLETQSLGPNVVFCPSRSVDVQSSVLDISRIRDIPSFEEPKDVSTGIDRYVSYLKNRVNI